MDTARCPACGAAAPDQAPWCTLCYADLRASRALAAAPATAPAREPVAALQPVPARTIGGAAARPAAVIPPAAAAEPAWPCLGCGAQVPMEADMCPHCGRPFLSADGGMPSLSLPGVGDVARLDKAERAVFVVAGMVAVTLLLVALAYLGGSIL